MKKLVLLSLFVLLKPGLWSILSAQPEGFTLLQNSEEFLTGLKISTSKTTTITADFTQHKEMQYLDAALKSSGKFWFKTPDKVRWEYTEPFSYTVILNEGKLLLISEESENRFDMNSSELFRHINSMMISAITGNIKVSDDYKTAIYEGRDYYLVVLTPTVPAMAEMIGSMELYFGKTQYLVKHVKIIEAGGDFSHIKFSNQQLNEDIKDSVFAL